MTDPSLMRAQTTALNPLISDASACPWEPTAPHAICDFLLDRRSLAPIQGSTHGDTVIWEFTKNAASISDMHLQCTRPALAIQAGATFMRWCDWHAVAEIREVKVEYFGNQIYKYTKEYLYTRAKRTLGPHKYLAFVNSIWADTDDAQRSILTQRGHVTVCKLMLPFSYDSTQAEPIVALAQKLQLQVTIEPLEAVLNSDLAVGTAVTCATRFTLLVDYIQLPERNTLNLVNKGMSDDGIAYLNSNKVYTQSVNVQVDTAIATPTLFQIPLFARGCVKEFMFYFVPLQLRTTSFGNAWFTTSNNPAPLPAPNGTVSMGAYAEILGWNIQANGVEAVRLQATQNILRWCKNFQFAMYHSGRPGENIYFWSFSAAPEQENAGLGNLAFANLDAPTLGIYFSPTVFGVTGGTGTNPISAANQTLICMILYYNYTYVQIQGGDIVEAFV